MYYFPSNSRSSLTHVLLVVALLLTVLACDQVVNPDDEEEENFEPISGLEQLRDLDGMWQGLEPRNENDHSSTRRYIQLTVDESLFHEIYHNPSDCYLVTENKILDSEDEFFVIELENGDVRNVIFSLDSDSERAKFENHLGHEFRYERSDATLTDFSPRCEQNSENISAAPLLAIGTD